MKIKCDECEKPIISRTHWYRRRKFCSMLCCQLYIEREKRLFDAKPQEDERQLSLQL